MGCTYSSVWSLRRRLSFEFHTRTNQTADQSALEGDVVEAADYVDHEVDDFWSGEDVVIRIRVALPKIHCEGRGTCISDHDLDTLRPFGMNPNFP